MSTDADSMLVVTCRCGHRMRLPVAAMGKTYKCVKCAERIVLTPDNAKAPGASAPPGADGSGARRGDGEAPPKPPVADTRVGQLLIREGLITEQQLQEALTRQAQRGGKLFEILIDLGYLGKKELHTFLSKQSGVASIDLKHYEIPYELIALIPREFAQRNVVLPIDKMGRLLTVGMACPLDTATIAEIERITGLKVKAMLCAFDDIHETIERYYPSDRPLFYERPSTAAPRSSAVRAPRFAREDVVARIQQCESLPALPDTVRRVREVMASANIPEKTIRDLAGIVCADPPLAAKTLSVANSTAYGLQGRVTNINLAVPLLGVSGTAELALAFDDVPPIDPAAQFDVKDFWLRSMFCAAAAMSIAKASGRVSVGEAYTAGLLHDIGALTLAAVFPEAYARTTADAGDDPVKAEEAVFGLGHPEAGYLLARQWRLPPPIAESIRGHHAAGPAGELRDHAAVVALAAVMTEAFRRRVPLADRLGPSRALLTALLLDEAATSAIFDRTSATLGSAVTP